MIKVENIDVWGFDHAIRGMRNPLNSWAKSDSFQCTGHTCQMENCPRYPDTYEWCDYIGEYVIGENDLDLMKRLYKAGTEHRKYLRQIFVSMDITAPLYWISEFDTYKIGTTRNSCSFMHKGISEPFTINNFSIHNNDVFDILTDLEKKKYKLSYRYETDEFRYYTCANGRRYKVYRNGRVFSLPFEYIDTLGRHRSFGERECTPSMTKYGYFELHIGGTNGEKWMLHRLVATVWLDNPNEYVTVDHINGDKGDNCVENLQWKTLEDNIQKGFQDGSYDRGRSLHARYQKWKNGHTVVNPIIKSQIINDHNSNGLTCKKIAEKYNITISQANNIISNKDRKNEELFLYAYVWEIIINQLNRLRDIYLETKDDEIFQQIRCLLPSGYNQKFTITMSYENVINMITQREKHRLDEWREFVSILKDLPYVKEIMGDVDD